MRYFSFQMSPKKAGEWCVSIVRWCCGSVSKIERSLVGFVFVCLTLGMTGAMVLESYIMYFVPYKETGFEKSV